MARELTTDTKHSNTHALRLFAPDHVPFTKRRWEAKNARCILNVKDYDGHGSNPDSWTEIELTEIETDKRGSDRSKTISITLAPAERDALIALLTRGAA